MTNSKRFTELVYKHLNGSLSVQEYDAFMQMLDKEENGPELERILRESFEESAKERLWSNEYREVFVNMLMEKVTADESSEPFQSVNRVRLLRMKWLRYAAAVLLIAATSIALYVNHDRPIQSVPKQSIAASKEKTIAPGGDKAVLTLADGGKIVLDSAVNGKLADQNGAKVVKLANGQIVYDLQGLASNEVTWNTLSTPRGGQYQVTLPDGTKVWLNASSSITFPTAFTGNKREVSMSGEVCFEVAKNIEKPFVVNVNKRSMVQVLGTTFNVNSYDDESSIKTTLVEGSVKCSLASATGDDANTIILKPGQQAQTTGDEVALKTNVDVDQVLAWKNGIFNFNGANLQEVMRQLARWYDITVQYEGARSNVKFKGEMYRNLNLTDVMEMLGKMGVKYRLEGKKLIVQ